MSNHTSTTKWLVWSFEHRGWWVGWSGYTEDINRATRFSLQEAITICDNANHHLYNNPPEEAMVPDWMEGHHAGRKPEAIKCESCGRSEGVEIGDYLQYGVLCEYCAKNIVPESFYKEHQTL